jgi:putative sterol carrier protein
MTTATTPEDVFNDKARALVEEPQRVAGLTARYRFDIAGDGGGVWLLDIEQGRATITREDTDQVDVHVGIDSTDLVALAAGQLNGFEAFMSGKIRVQGNMEYGMRLADILA